MLCPTVLHIIPVRGVLWLEVQAGRARIGSAPTLVFFHNDYPPTQPKRPFADVFMSKCLVGT